MKNVILIYVLTIQTFGFGQNDSIWTFNEYWGLLPDGDGLSVGGAIDRQNDGVLDLLYTTDIGVNEDIIIYPMGLLINDGNGGLSLGSDSLLIDAESTQSGKIYVYDFNNDGLDDAYIDDTGNDIEPFPGGQNILLIQDTDGRLINETNTRLPIQNTWTSSSVIGDVDLDGDLDILNLNNRQDWNQAEVGTQLLMNDGNGYFSIDSTRLPIEISEAVTHSSAVFLDAENDGDLDLYLGNLGEIILNDELYINDGDGYFSLKPNAVITEYDMGEPRFILSEDFNNDTFDDILMTYALQTNGYSELKLLLNTGDTTFIDASTNIDDNDWHWFQDLDGGGTIAYTYSADLNNDGLMDFIVGIPFTIYINNGDAIFSKQTDIIPFDEMNWYDIGQTGYPEFVTIITGDFDGDLDTDLFLSQYGEPLFVLYNPSNELNISETMQNIVSEYNIQQNYPNPFNPVTTLRYDLPEDALVNITIYDMMGRVVKTMVNTEQNAGFKSVRWNATNDKGAPVSAGLYLYTIEAGQFRQTKKMVLLK